jgi:hypothetical protein
LSDEGQKFVAALEKARILPIIKGLEPAQAKLLLENAKKPVMLYESTLPDKEILDLIKKTNSAIGLILGNEENAATYAAKIDAAKQAIGTEYLSIVGENCLWEDAGRKQMLNVISELLKAKYENEELAALFSGTFMRVLGRARAEDAPRF